MADQLAVQGLAVLVAIVWSALVALAAMLAVKAVFGVRVSEADETDGLDLTAHGERAYN